jgi:hypothetical protein
MSKPTQQGQERQAPPVPSRSTMISIPEHSLDELRMGFEDNVPCNKRIEKFSAELRVRSDPDRVIPGKRIELPWSREARARSKARDMSVEARLDVFKDDLRAIRIANEVLNRAETMRAVEAAEAAIFEIRCIGETARFAILNRTHLDMTHQFLDQLDSIESLRGRVSSEILDALKERALNEFTARMNRASKADVEFSKSDILKLKS